MQMQNITQFTINFDIHFALICFQINSIICSTMWTKFSDCGHYSMYDESDCICVCVSFDSYKLCFSTFITYFLFSFFKITSFNEEMSILQRKFITVLFREALHGYLKLIPYFLVTWGEWIDATDSSNGTSFADKLSAVVTVFSEQNSVAKRKAANVSDCK